jgi:hypothetical protein
VCLQGSGRNIDVLVSVADYIGVGGVRMSYLPPTVARVEVTQANGSVSTWTPAVGRRVRGPTTGGYNVTVFGSNFGTRDASHCVFVAGQGVSPPPQLQCDGVEYPTGEGEVLGDHLLSHDHAAVRFVMPPGVGVRVLSIVVRGQWTAALPLFQYEDPVLLSLSPATGGTDGGSAITLVGANFGDGSLAHLGSLDVHFGRSLCSNRTCPAGVRCDCAIASHSHTSVVVVTPPGIGVNRSVAVRVTSGGASVVTRPLNFSYSPPSIDYILPSTMDADGEPLSIRGSNFGTDLNTSSWTAEELAVVVVVSNVSCEGAQRVTRNGRTALECVMGRQLVGEKNVSITVAGQSSTIYEWSQMLVALCATNYYGRTGELCLPCPLGADCAGKRADPVAQPGWFILNGTGAAMCPPERLQRPYCDYVVPCEPKEACTGNNTCARGYLSVAPVFRCAACNPCYRSHPGAKCQAFYRRGGECVKCPNMAWLLIVAFVVVAAGCCAAGYLLSRKQVRCCVGDATACAVHCALL